MGINMHRWGYRSTPECPRCKESESTIHVLQRKSEEANVEFWEAVEPLAEWLTKKARPAVGEAILDHALACRDKRDSRVDTEWPIEIQQATLAQV